VSGSPWIVPFERNPHFTGREPQLAELERLLFADDRTAKVAIVGLGGVGKTQLVLELLFRTRYKHANFTIIWIPATNSESLHQAYLEVAQQLRIPGWEDDKQDVKRMVQEYLSKERTGRWLLVFDNANNIDMWIAKESGPESGLQHRHGFRSLINCLPKSNQGAIVFTTRDRDIASKLAQQSVVNVPAMGEDAATRLLEKCLVNPNLINSTQDKNTLLSQLTYLPLAIVQAAAYINKNGTTLGDYVLLLADQEVEVIKLLSENFEHNRRYCNIETLVATTWLISFEQIRHRDPLAADYLSFMACIEPRDIPQSLLPSGASRKREIDAIGTLTAYSFITRQQEDTALDLHRLVHLAIRNWLRKEDQLAKWTEKAIVQLEDVFRNDSYKNRGLWRTYLPHVRFVLQSDVVDKDWEPRIDLLWRYGSCLYEDGRWDEAEKVSLQVIKIRNEKLGADHPSTLTSMANLAIIYSQQGRENKAEKLKRQVIETRKEKLGADHPDTLTSIADLAVTCGQQGREDEAEKLLLQVIEIQNKKLGADHLDTLTSIANLAVTYSQQGRQDKAKKLQRQVIEIQKEKLGADHPDTLTSIADLAATYSQQGRQNKAEKLLLQVIEIQNKKLGADHPFTLTSMANLGVIYSQQGRQDKAEKLKRQVMETRKEKLGVDHPDTLTSIANLAVTYSQQGRQDEAEKLKKLMSQVAEIQEKDCPDTLTSKANLAVTSTDLINLFDGRKIFVALKEVFTQYGVWNIWPLAGVYGRISAMIGREYLFQREPFWKRFHNPL
jgi:tetratricopeptide (TPR) repeat protein